MIGSNQEALSGGARGGPLRSLWLGIAVTAALGACGSDEESFQAGDLAGTWESPQCESGRGADGSEFFYQRRFVMSASAWSIDFTMFGDSGCAAKLATVEISGPFQLGARVQGLPGAREGNFSGSRKQATAWVPGMAELFAASGCGSSAWTLGVAQDLGATGCAPLGLDKVADCPVEFDIVKLDGSKLYFGDRSGGMCDSAKRTTKLQSVPVVKK